MSRFHFYKLLQKDTVHQFLSIPLQDALGTVLGIYQLVFRFIFVFWEWFGALRDCVFFLIYVDFSERFDVARPPGTLLE